MFRQQKRPSVNPWQGFVIGAAGAAAGLIAMQAYWTFVAPAVKEKLEPEEWKPKREKGDDALDDISLIGKHYEEGESSTDALGRILYTKVAGKEPKTKEAKTVLSYLVHWVYGMWSGGMYGSTLGEHGGLNLMRGALFGTMVWLFGDEITMPITGLQAGPTAVSPVQHLNRWGSHIAYGVGTAVTAAVLFKLFGRVEE